MYSHHRYLKSPFLRSKKSQEEAQLLPEVGLARKHTRNMDDGVAMVSLHYSNQYNFRVHGIRGHETIHKTNIIDL